MYFLNKLPEREKFALIGWIAMNVQKIGLRIRNARNEKHLLQKDLADQLNINPKYLSAIERGTKCPSLDLIIQIANCLGVGTDVLLMDSLTALHGCDPAELSDEAHLLSLDRLDKLRDLNRFLIEHEYV